MLIWTPVEQHNKDRLLLQLNVIFMDNYTITTCAVVLDILVFNNKETVTVVNNSEILQ